MRGASHLGYPETSQSHILAKSNLGARLATAFGMVLRLPGDLSDPGRLKAARFGLMRDGRNGAMDTPDQLRRTLAMVLFVHASPVPVTGRTTGL